MSPDKRNEAHLRLGFSLSQHRNQEIGSVSKAQDVILRAVSDYEALKDTVISARNIIVATTAVSE